LIEDAIIESNISPSKLKQMFDYRLSRLRQSMAKKNISLVILQNPVSLRYALILTSISFFNHTFQHVIYLYL